MFIRRFHGCMNASVLPSGEMRKKPRSGWRKKSRTGIGAASAALAGSEANEAAPAAIMMPSAAQEERMSMDVPDTWLPAEWSRGRTDCTPCAARHSSGGHERRQGRAHHGRDSRGTTRGAVDPHVNEVPRRRRIVLAAAEKPDLVGHRRVAELGDAQSRIDDVGKG